MKSRKDPRQSFRLTRNGFRVRVSGHLFVAKIGDIRVRWSRALPSEPSSVTIIREPDGHYYASFVVDVPVTPLPVVVREAGMDVGLIRLATIATTDGMRTDIANPKHLGRKLRKLRRLEREKSRRQKGSVNRQRTRRKVATTHNQVARSRRDYHHKQAFSARCAGRPGEMVGGRRVRDREDHGGARYQIRHAHPARGVLRHHSVRRLRPPGGHHQGRHLRAVDRTGRPRAIDPAALPRARAAQPRRVRPHRGRQSISCR